MPLDPQAHRVLEQAAAAGWPPYHTISVEEARRIMLVRSAATAGEVDADVAAQDRQIPGPGGTLPLRIFTPSDGVPRPLLVYFHGGGWVLGNLDTHDALCRSLSKAAGCLVVSVDYRLAPENPFPAAVEDAYAATRWVAENAVSIGGDPRRIAVGGDSAGGTIATVVAMMARERGGPTLGFQLLLYPITDHQVDTPSYRQFAEGYMLTRADMIWYWNHYLRHESDGGNPYASPLRAKDLTGLPPALMITAEFDPLRDEGEAYAALLREAGVPVTATRYAGMIHGFLRMTTALDQARAAVQQIGEALREALAV